MRAAKRATAIVTKRVDREAMEAAEVSVLALPLGGADEALEGEALVPGLVPGDAEVPGLGMIEGVGILTAVTFPDERATATPTNLEPETRQLNGFPGTLVTLTLP